MVTFIQRGIYFSEKVHFNSAWKIGTSPRKGSCCDQLPEQCFLSAREKYCKLFVTSLYCRYFQYLLLCRKEVYTTTHALYDNLFHGLEAFLNRSF